MIADCAHMEFFDPPMKFNVDPGEAAFIHLDPPDCPDHFLKDAASGRFELDPDRLQPFGSYDDGIRISPRHGRRGLAGTRLHGLGLLLHRHTRHAGHGLFRLAGWKHGGLVHQPQSHCQPRGNEHDQAGGRTPCHGTDFLSFFGPVSDPPVSSSNLATAFSCATISPCISNSLS